MSLSWLYSENRASTNINSLTDKLNIKHIISQKPSGTPPHAEDEYKFSVTGDEYILNKNSYLISKIQSKLKMAVQNDSLWEVPRILGGSYSMGKTGKGTFCFVDIYLDTDNYLNRKLNVSHRVRYRWHSEPAFWRYMFGNPMPENFPHRCEFQTKIYTKKASVPSEISQAVESRFEFRNESFPFKTDRSAPQPPWPFQEYVPMAINGHYKDYTVYPTFEYAKFLNEQNKNMDEVILRPSVIVVTVRRRSHIDITTNFGKVSSKLGMGAASNANQAILLTLDTSYVFSPSLLEVCNFADMARKRRSLTKRLVKRLKNSVKCLGHFSELEVEFERNVSSAVDYEASRSENTSNLNRLNKIKSAFFKDVKTASGIVKDTLNQIGLDIKKSKVSKYRKSLNILLGSL